MLSSGSAALVDELTGRADRIARRAFERAVGAPEVDEILAAALDRAPFPMAIAVASALGDRSGPHGTGALRRVLTLTGRGTADLKGIAALALAKRCDAEATPWLRDALRGAGDTVTGYVLIGLAGAGDDRAWDAVLAKLPRLARYKVRASPASLYVIAAAYLARHLSADTGRLASLANRVRADWPLLPDDDRAWFAQHCPCVVPSIDGEPHDIQLPDPEALRAWAREPLFRPSRNVWT